MQSLKDIILVLKDKKNVSDRYGSNIDNQISGLPKEIFKNVLQNASISWLVEDTQMKLNNLH